MPKKSDRPVIKGGFAEDQPLVIGKRYDFVYTEHPGGIELHFRGILDAEDDTHYTVSTSFSTTQIPIDRTLEVNEVIAGE